MIRARLLQVSLPWVGLVGLASMTVDCARRQPSPVEDTGNFRFSLKLSSLAEIDSVSYVVSGNGITPISGMIDLTGSNVASAVVSGLPAAMGYSMSATATSTDKKTKCVGNTTFAITDGSETDATLILECTGPNQAGTGAVRIDGTFDNCPVVTSLVAIPASVPVGGVISAIGTYADLDGDPITYSWSQNPLLGALGSPTAARTTFTCSSVGVATLSFQVSDGSCAKAGTISVACLAAGADAGAGGVLGSGGSGAGGATSTGGGGVGGWTGAGGDTASADSGAGVDSAADGPIATGGSGAGGSGVGGATGGSGAGGSGTGGAMACAVPSHCDSMACEQCTFGQQPGEPDLCDSSSDGCFNCNPDTMGCDRLTDPNDKSLCETLYACLVAPKHPGDPTFPNFCISPGGDPIPCWCGSNSLTCVTSNAPPTQANGPCLQQIFAAAKTTDAATINARFIDPSFPLGAAANLAICRGSFCTPECALPPL